MREICTSGSVGGEGGNILAYPASSEAKPIIPRRAMRFDGFRLRSTHPTAPFSVRLRKSFR